MVILFSHWLEATIVLAILNPSRAQSSLQSKFSQFELLTSRHITVRVRRDKDGQVKDKKVTLSIFGRKISLSLTSGLPDTVGNTDNFYAIHKNGTKSRIHLDHGDFHEGVIKGHPGSRVHSVHHRELWVIQAIHPTLSFSVEPLNFYKGYEKTRQMLVFRHRDMKTMINMGMPFCKHMQYNRKSSNPYGSTISTNEKLHFRRNEEPVKQAFQNHNSTNGRGKENFKVPRKRRDLDSSLYVCDMLSIADYKFFKGVGGGSVVKTTKLLIYVFAIANDIFSTTKFHIKKSIGIKIRAMHVHTHPSYEIHGVKDDNEVMTAEFVIGNMTTIPYFKNYCLVHYSTQRLFKWNTLGASLMPDETDEKWKNLGICGSSSGQVYSLNVGLSTTVATSRAISYTEYALVVAHELGHNFGAGHDKSNVLECNPNENQGGHYIMWYRNGEGLNPNNWNFSPCSIKSISSVLKRRDTCLISNDILSNNLCGNGKVDYGEDCDVGIYNHDGHNQCCTSECRLKENATCSSFNHPCCQHCTVAPKTKTCYNGLATDCSNPSYCDGVDFQCPASEAKPNGAKCRNAGECQHGHCVERCSLLSLSNNFTLFESCTCTSKDELCTVCCREVGKTDCKSVGLLLDEGSPCSLGYCQKGKCTEMKNTYWRAFYNLPNAAIASKRLEPIQMFTMISLIAFTPVALLIGVDVCLSQCHCV